MTPLAWYVVETLVTLAGVCALAVLVLYGARRVGIGRATGPLELVGRLPLDGRRAVYLVRVGKTIFVVGGSEAGLAKLGEIERDGLDFEPVTHQTRSFAEVLAQVVGRQRAAGERAE